MFKDGKLLSIAVAGYILCIYLVYFLYSPSIAVGAIRQAMQEQNADLLDDYVDFNALQQSLLAQVNAELVLKASVQVKEDDEARSLVLHRVSNVMQSVEDFIGPFVSRNGLARLFEEKNGFPDDPKLAGTKKYIASLQSDEFMGDGGFEFVSFGVIRMKGFNANGDAHHFEFSFTGVRWELTDFIIDLHDVSSDQVVRFIKSFDVVS